jgi:hypothetical protein
VTLIVVQALSVALSVLLYAMLIPRYDSCVRKYGPSPEPGTATGTRGWPCRGVLLEGGAVLLTMYVLVAVALCVALVFGIVDGRRRRRFADGRWVHATLVGLTGPWALLTYAIAYLPARLLPPPRPTPRAAVDLALTQGWQAAVDLYVRLATGQEPVTVTAPGVLLPGPIHMDAVLTYSRFYGMDVTYGQTSTVAFGSPAFVAGSLLADVVGNSVARSRATNLARAQWREHQQTRVVLTGSTTWCAVNGQWLAFDHDAVVEYLLDGPSAILTFAGVEPLRLYGPAVWCHAVLFAYARHDAEHWQQAPYLQPIRQAALLSHGHVDFPSPVTPHRT